MNKIPLQSSIGVFVCANFISNSFPHRYQINFLSYGGRIFSNKIRKMDNFNIFQDNASALPKILFSEN